MQGNRKLTRDFIHIEDCRAGVLTTLDSLENGSCLNFSIGGLPTTFLDFARISTIQYGYDPKILGDRSNPTGILPKVGDSTKQKLMGFSSNIYANEGIKKP